MTLRYGDVEFVGLLLWIALFVIAERRWPGPSVDRRRQLRLDLLALATLVAAANVVRPLLLTAMEGAGLREAFGPLRALRALPAPGRILAGFVITDFLLYGIHRAMHGPLWRTHRWHHSIEELYWFSGFRTSVAHAFLFAIPQVAVAFFLFDMSQLEAGVAFGLGAFFQFWDHTSSRLSLGPLDAVVISPRYHRVHHTCTLEHQRSNYGIFLTVWDRLFGTYRDPATVADDAPLGLGEEAGVARMVLGV